MKPKKKHDENAELPVAVRASASWKRRAQWPKTRYRSIQYDARFADGREEQGVKIDEVLQGWRYPADAWCVRGGAEKECPEEGAGPWVDYPYGRPL
ncbi:hypothetical protein [Arthrobacter glacialis]|uniref:hypothetical protein n=1 Tax=Arthrobacter glacialis TaxID=1664 RepID=UPI0013FD597D|nr:hypothetical protein [Arthrobacter glacialis]